MLAGPANLTLRESMFDQYATLFWLVLFAGLLFYALWRRLGAPYLRNRRYAQIGLQLSADTDLSRLAGGDSLLLNRLQPGPVYGGRYRGHSVWQFAASPKWQKPSLYNRAQRRRDHQAWTVTVLQGVRDIPRFCARPVKARDAMAYLLDTDNVIFPDDELFANKVHVLAEDHEQIVAAFTEKLRATLDGIDPLSLESVNSLLLLKSPRQPHDGGMKMQAELDVLVDMYDALTNSVAQRNR